MRIGQGDNGAAAPPKFGQLRFLGQQEKFGQTNFKRTFHVRVVSFRRGIFSILN